MKQKTTSEITTIVRGYNKEERKLREKIYRLDRSLAIKNSTKHASTRKKTFAKLVKIIDRRAALQRNVLGIAGDELITWETLLKVMKHYHNTLSPRLDAEGAG